MHVSKGGYAVCAFFMYVNFNVKIKNNYFISPSFLGRYGENVYIQLKKNDKPTF